MTDLHIRPARLDELPTVEALLREVSEWLASRGIDQWQFPPHRDRIISALHRGEVFLAEVEGRPVATLQVDDQADPEFWTAEDKPEDALYVHRMAVTREFAGAGIGGRLLDWATQRAAEAGKPWLRLDAWKDNHGLHRYYERQGFTRKRVVDLPHRGSGALFQRLVPPASLGGANLRIGDAVRVTDGPFAEFTGPVHALDLVRGRVQLIVDIMGDASAIDVPLSDVRRVV